LSGYWTFIKLNRIINTKILLFNPFSSSFFKTFLKNFLFGETHLNMLELFLKKKILSSGSAFKKCETGVTLKLLVSINSYCAMKKLL